jgi:hypothetical protein
VSTSLLATQDAPRSTQCIHDAKGKGGNKVISNRVLSRVGGRYGFAAALATVAAIASAAVAAAPAAANASVDLKGSFSTTLVKPNFAGSTCAAGVDGNECGVLQFASLGPADSVYRFGPTFEPNGRCFGVDGTLTITLQSDGSTISGSLTGLFCPRPSDTGHQHAGAISYGNPFVEDDSIAFADGTGQFDGLSGSASFHTFSAGALFKGTLTGTLSG